MAVSDGDNRIRRLELKTALRMHVDMTFCKICECIVSFYKSGKLINSTLTTPPIHYVRVLGIANRILLVVHFYIASIYIQSLIILPLMTSSLYLVFIAHHGKLPMCRLLSSSLFRCHVELWCTNRFLFRVIYLFFALTLFFVNGSVDGKGKIS